jgi:hypothetical protein
MERFLKPELSRPPNFALFWAKTWKSLISVEPELHYEPAPAHGVNEHELSPSTSTKRRTHGRTARHHAQFSSRSSNSPVHAPEFMVFFDRVLRGMTQTYFDFPSTKTLP